MFVLIARYWNEIEWINTSLKYILQWNPDKIMISEGNWSTHPSFRGRENSTDGTREVIEKFIRENSDRATMVEGVRVFMDYRKNQAATCRKALELSEAKSRDWFITIDCDSFISESSIDFIRKRMNFRTTRECYFPYMINHFFWDLETCVTLKDIHGNLLPRRILKGASFPNANHYGLDGKYYTGNKSVVSFPLVGLVEGYHYCGIKNPQRIVDRYNLGDKLKQKPEKKGYDKKRKPFIGKHPAIVQEYLAGEYHAVS